MKKIAFYFQKLNKPINNIDRIDDLINLHVKTFQHYGWEVVLLDESVAAKHKDYELFNNPDTILARSRNPWEYTRACYMRWLAYAVAGYPFSDFDVINYGFTPTDAINIKSSAAGNSPVFISAAGAMGLTEGSEWQHVIDTYINFINNPVVEGVIKEDINDMTIMRQLHPEWYSWISYSDVNFVKDYSHPGWDLAKMVHFPHGLTPIPRVDSIMKVRPPVM